MKFTRGDRISFLWTTLLLSTLFWPCLLAEIVCPPYQDIPYCSCFVLDDQLHIQCSGSDFATLKKSLQVLNGPVKSFSVYDLDARASVLPNGLTDNVTSPVFHLQISHSSVEDLAENSLRGLAKSLESLAVVSSRLKFIPQSTLATLRRLKMLDFEANQLQELGPYSFHNILLQKLNLKGNLLENISEHSFWGLEETLMDIDMSENKLKSFPYLPLRRLRLLSSLNLAWNELNDLETLLPSPPSPSSSTSLPERRNNKPAHSGAFDVIRSGLKNGGGLGSASNGILLTYGVEKESSSSPGLTVNSKELNAPMDWPLLKYLNLNSNYLRTIGRSTFLPMRNLRSLLLHLNSIESLHPEVFHPLQELESIDLSHNKLTLLPSSTFAKNSHLVFIDLSNNHLHTVGEGLLQNLPELKELFLNGNNILRLLAPTFLHSPKVSVLYLQGNALRYIESGAFVPLKNLTEIRLSDNFLRILPQDLFLSNEALSSLSLDGNHLTKIAPGTFSSSSKGLKELRLQNNQISSISPGVFDSLASLEEIHLENNKLTMIRGLSSLRRIRHVTLSRNSFERLSGEMLPGNELSSLSLGHNSIRSIADGTFLNQSTLSILFLGNNKLTRLGPRIFLGLRSLERLYLQKNNISWIHPDTFSSQTKALQYLDLSYNELQSISRTVFAGLAFIEEINLSNNFISSLEEGAFSYLRSLRILDLSYNKLTILDYSQVFHPGGLEILKLCCNSLKEFYVRTSSPGSSSLVTPFPHSNTAGGNSGNSPPSSSGEIRLSPGIAVALRELDLQQNSLTGSTFRQIEMGRVEVLQISGNNLTDLDEAMLDGFPSLSFFSADKSHITSLPGTLFRSNGALAVIRLSDNFISHIPESAFLPEIPGRSQPSSSPLRELHLRHNKLRAFPYKALSNCSSLEVLTLSGNRINTLDLNRISLPRLKQLDMNDNRLNKISGSSLTKSMPLLQVVDFGENNISRVANDFVKNLSLSQINFGGNSMEKVPYAFSDKWVGGGSPNSQVSFVLNMSGNPLINFYTEDHHNTNFSVMDLYLCDTNVSYLTSEEFKIYPRLHRLVIKRNPLSILPPAAFSNLANLNLLDLSENAIEEVTFDSFTGLLQLKSLNLSHNRIKDVQPFHTNLGGLQDLDLSYNQIFRLAPENFAKLISLVTLRIRGNIIVSLPSELFGPLARLAVLDLSKNAIESIPSSTLRHFETRISALRLEENPLKCDCESKDLWEWLQSHPKVFTPRTSSTSSSGGLPSKDIKSSPTGLLIPASQPNFICDRPDEFRGKPILEVDLDSFCSSPAIVKVDIQEVQPSSAIVSWEGRNNSLMNGYMIAYHALNHDNRIQWTHALPATSRAYRIPNLESDTPYLFCVLGLVTQSNSNMTSSALTLLPAETVLRDSPVSRCTKINTSLVSGDKLSFLQRRLGVVVGASVGVLVFFVLMILLTCVKVKKRHVRRQEENGKFDPNQHHRVQDALPTTNAVGTLGSYHSSCNNHSDFMHHHHHHHHNTVNSSAYSTLTRLDVNGKNNGINSSSGGTSIIGIAGGGGGVGGNNGGCHLSPEFLTYRNYSIGADTNTEMERL